eukprot:11202832-Lingulodinium_polyedra.AAC.1
MKGVGALPMRKHADGTVAIGPSQVAEATLRHSGNTEAAEATEPDALRTALRARPQTEGQIAPIASAPTRRQLTT